MWEGINIKLVGNSGRKSGGSSGPDGVNKNSRGGGQQNTRQASQNPPRGASGAKPERKRDAQQQGKTQRTNAPRSAAKHGKKKRDASRPVLIACIVAAALVTTVLAAAFVVSRGDKVYPNISLDGVPLGGTTLSEAASILEGAGFDSLTDKSVSINFPMDHTLEISAKEAGILAAPDEVAQIAFNYGRDGNLFSNLISYIKCSLGGAELTYEESFTIDERYVRERIDDMTREVNAALIGSETEIGEDYISIVKGASSVTVDPAEVYSLIENAFITKNYTIIDYSPEILADDSINLQQLYDSVYVAPINSVYDKETNEVTAHVNGISFDIDEARKLWDDTMQGNEVRIPLILTEPEITSEKLKSLIFADILGQKSSTLSGSSNSRVNNISLASKAINGLILNPGEEFSYNTVVGQRTAAGGYQSAGAYENGQVINAIGGGICQVSSTIYNAALLANLEIVHREPHYFTVAYLPLGLDATVSWPSPDFKFKNNREYPIKIEVFVDSASYSVVVRIYGTNVDGSRVEMTSETWLNATGQGATTYRNVYDKDGNLISRNKEATSQYHLHTDPSPSPSPSESPSPSASPGTSPSESPGSSPSSTPASTTPSTPTENPTSPIVDPTTPATDPTDPGGDTEPPPIVDPVE